MAAILRGEFPDGSQWQYGTYKIPPWVGQWYFSIQTGDKQTIYIIPKLTSLNIIPLFGADKGRWTGIALKVLEEKQAKY